MVKEYNSKSNAGIDITSESKMYLYSLTPYLEYFITFSIEIKNTEYYLCLTT